MKVKSNILEEETARDCSSVITCKGSAWDDIGNRSSPRYKLIFEPTLVPCKPDHIEQINQSNIYN